ncbi:Aste57867_20180 [Aphanomyces stellatus]|uniref:Aste57867_20180 protein n=1 Tax=Aphanomyces stellatus TaxID=120398 RepID=A0A485LEJ7_9STRA|nr:hypothetical protein As57867_020114 [Aphanomyces stellatus]VFT96874.1 Aste57867_20180 [Aphanomyces stellatus]
MQGSFVANFVDDHFCHDGLGLSADVGTGLALLTALAPPDLTTGAASLVAKACTNPDVTKSMVHISTADAKQKVTYKAAQDVVATYVTHAACGVDPTGLMSPFSELNQLVVDIVPPQHGTETDCEVDLASCTTALDARQFQPTYTSPFYKAALNHLDLTFRYGDGDGDDQKPVAWFECLL